MEGTSKFWHNKRCRKWLMMVLLALPPLSLLALLRNRFEVRNYERKHTLIHRDAVTGMAFSPDGQTLKTSTVGWQVQAWNVANALPANSLHSDIGSLTALHPADKGRSLVAISDNPVRCQWWNARSGASLRIVDDPHLGGAVMTTRLIDVLPLDDGRLLACSIDFRNGGYKSYRSDCTEKIDWVHLWDMKTGRDWSRFAFCDSPTCVALTGKGSLLATGDSDGQVRLWAIPSNRLLRMLTVTPRHQQRGMIEDVSDLAFSPDGETLAVSGGNEITLWNPRSGRLLQTLQSGNVRWKPCLTFSTDGKKVAAVEDSKTLHVWKAADGTSLYTRSSTDASRVESVAFSPDGTRIATGSSTRVRLWELP